MRANGILAEINAVMDAIDAEKQPIADEMETILQQKAYYEENASGFLITESSRQRQLNAYIDEYNALLPSYNGLVARRARLVELWYVVADYRDYGTLPTALDRADLFSEGISWD